MNTQRITTLPKAEIANQNIQRFINEQADFYIGWNYDYLVRCAQDEAGKKTLSQAQKDQLKQEAINKYKSAHAELIQDLQAIGA